MTMNLLITSVIDNGRIDQYWNDKRILDEMDYQDWNDVEIDDGVSDQYWNDYGILDEMDY